MRLIDADALIDKLQKEEELIEADGYYCNNYNIIAELERTPTACAWIPVEERLPEDRQQVLATVVLRGMNCLTYDKKTNSFYCQHYSIPPESVTAWMPLPEPYNPQ